MKVVQILSGVLDGLATGAPIALQIANQDQRPQDYQANQALWRGHADFSYAAKYQHFAQAGGGRASGRLPQMSFGAIAAEMLAQHQVEVVAFILKLALILLKMCH